MIIRLRRSLEMTQRLFPKLAAAHAADAFGALRDRYTQARIRGAKLQSRLAQVSKARPKATQSAQQAALGDAGSQVLNELQSLAESLVPAQMALYDAVSLATDGNAPSLEQVQQMFRQYTLERRRLERQLRGEPLDKPVNYARLQGLEGGLNLWLRRVSEAMGRALEERHYSRYANDLRLLANRRLGRASNRNLLKQADVTELPNLARDLLIAGSQVNIFLSNSVSLQFAPDTMNSVSTEVQASLPESSTLTSRISQAAGAAASLNSLQQATGVDSRGLLGAILAGGQPVPIRSGMQLSATPSIGFDGGSLTLNLTATQTVEPSGAPVADRVTRHNISNATISAVSYEPMVLSTLTSNTSYYEETGGVPLLRKVPLLKDLLKQSPIKQLRPRKRQRGVYQSSVIILEPVVIPTIEDLIRFHSAWRLKGEDGEEARPDQQGPTFFPGRIGKH